MLSSAAAHAITVDGNIDAAYGAPTAVIATDTSAPTGNFGSPTLTANAGYSIYLDNTGSTLYGLIAGSGQGNVAGSFTNLYFGQPSPIGSTIGFEITNQDAFTPGVPGSVSVPINFVINGNNIEFAIPDSYFTTTLGGSVNAGFTDGQTIQLRLSQSLSYSVAGNPTDPNDLGTFTLEAAVPEPSTWAMMILGFCGIGFMAYRQKKNGASFTTA